MQTSVHVPTQKAPRGGLELLAPVRPRTLPPSPPYCCTLTIALQMTPKLSATVWDIGTYLSSTLYPCAEAGGVAWIPLYSMYKLKGKHPDLRDLIKVEHFLYKQLISEKVS